MLALGVAIASGAYFTQWSTITNGLFLVAGATLAVLSLSTPRSPSAGRAARERARRARIDRRQRRAPSPDDSAD